MERETPEDESRLDLYAVLELTREASLDEIRVAFRKIAAKNHPDRNEGDSKAALRFKRANAAYQVLSDPEKRELYDQLTTPIEEIPQAPPPEAMVRGAEAREWRPPVESHGTTATRRRRRRVRKTAAIGWAWGVMIAAALLFILAWILVPEGGIRFDHPSPSTGAASSDGVTPTAGSSYVQSGSGALSSAMGGGRIGSPVDPLANGGNPRERASTYAVTPSDVEIPTHTVSGDKWTFEVPTDWQSAGGATTTSWKAPGDGASVTLLISTFTGDSAGFFKSLDRKSRGLVIDAEAWESESQPDGLRRDGRIVRENTVVAQFVEYVVAVRGHGYELRCTASAAAFEGAAPICERILGSLQIK